VQKYRKMAERVMSAQLSISPNSLEPEDLDRLSRDLERQLTETGGVAFSPTPPLVASGQRGDPVTIGTLLLAAVTSGTVSALFNIIKSFVDRGLDLTFEGTGSDGKPIKIAMKGIKLTKFRSMLFELGVLK
jgi:hypothetical protein